VKSAPLLKKTPGLLAIFACLLLPGFARAQSLSVKELASRVDHHYNALHSLQINFTQHYQGMGMDRRESGVLSALRAVPAPELARAHALPN